MYQLEALTEEGTVVTLVTDAPIMLASARVISAKLESLTSYRDRVLHEGFDPRHQRLGVELNESFEVKP